MTRYRSLEIHWALKGIYKIPTLACIHWALKGVCKIPTLACSHKRIGGHMEVLHQPLMATVHVVKAITITVALRQAVCFHKVMAQPGLQAFRITMLVSEPRGSGTHSNSHFPLSPFPLPTPKYSPPLLLLRRDFIVHNWLAKVVDWSGCAELHAFPGYKHVGKTWTLRFLCPWPTEEKGPREKTKLMFKTCVTFKLFQAD